MSFFKASSHKERVHTVACTPFPRGQKLFLMSCSPAELASASFLTATISSRFFYFQPVHFMGSPQYEALRNLIFDNVQLYIGAEAEFKAGNQIRLKPGTHVYSGTNVSFSIADIIPSCDKLSELVMPPLNRIVSKEREMKLEVHEPIGLRNLLNHHRITNYSMDNQLFVFPNPFDNRLDLRLESNTGEIIKNLIIYSSSGKTIYEQYASQHTISINLPNLTKGLYLLKIIDGNGRFYTQKLIKQ